jgi:hypothetical protein
VSDQVRAGAAKRRFGSRRKAIACVTSKCHTPSLLVISHAGPNA